MSTTPNQQPTPRDLQARRIHWISGVSPEIARTLAGLVYGSAAHD
ncbi:MAG: hypothetical protein N4A53_01405 [Pelagimonas sp.]|jgi:hypothetical protein|nr:hypothetical protein [Pelagimonas sp.]